MRTRKIIGLLIPLIQIILVLKLIELVEGDEVTSKLPRPITSSKEVLSRFLAARLPKAFRKLSQTSYWTTSSTLPPVTVIDQIISYDVNGTEVGRRNATRRIESPLKKNEPPCPSLRFFFWKFCINDFRFLKMLLPQGITEM